MPWGVAAAAAGAIGGALISSNAAGKASNAQAQSAADANATQLEMYNQTRADQEPWRRQGEWGLNQLQESLRTGFQPGNLAQDPGYQFELQQGMQGLDRSAASRGRLYSGAQMQAADRFATNFAGTKYNDAYNRWQAGNNALAGLAGVGQSAANSQGQAAQAYGQAYGNNVTGAANAQASGYLAQGNALSGALQQGAGAIGYGLDRRSAGPWSGGGAAGSGWGSSFGTPGLDSFYYGSGTSGD